VPPQIQALGTEKDDLALSINLYINRSNFDKGGIGHGGDGALREQLGIGLKEIS
jgi:hypothetical protein